MCPFFFCLVHREPQIHMATVLLLIALIETTEIGGTCKSHHAPAAIPVSSPTECHQLCEINPQCEGFSLAASGEEVHCLHFSQVHGTEGKCTISSCCFARVLHRTQWHTPDPLFFLLGVLLCVVLVSSKWHHLSTQRAAAGHNAAPASDIHVELSGRVNGFPMTVWSAESGVDAECVLCITGYETGDSIRHLPCCAHVYHAECIDRWLTGAAGRTCPLCKADPFVGGASHGPAGRA